MLGMIAWWLTVIGALNWGLLGAFGIDIVTMILGAGTIASKITYIVIGVAAVLTIVDGVRKK